MTDLEALKLLLVQISAGNETWHGPDGPVPPKIEEAMNRLEALVHRAESTTPVGKAFDVLLANHVFCFVWDDMEGLEARAQLNGVDLSKFSLEQIRDAAQAVQSGWMASWVESTVENARHGCLDAMIDYLLKEGAKT